LLTWLASKAFLMFMAGEANSPKCFPAGTGGNFIPFICWQACWPGWPASPGNAPDSPLCQQRESEAFQGVYLKAGNRGSPRVSKNLISTTLPGGQAQPYESFAKREIMSARSCKGQPYASRGPPVDCDKFSMCVDKQGGSRKLLQRFTSQDMEMLRILQRHSLRAGPGKSTGRDSNKNRECSPNQGCKVFSLIFAQRLSAGNI